jgi:tetratricopeptide (TPR) repeat protein
MPDNPRIEELRRRVQQDPASIAFAQLAEEYRRAGNYEDSIETCRAGLAIHPGYLSARVTLGRAFIEVNNLDEAQRELEYVLQHAPENLAAIRGMAEIHHRRGSLGDALAFYRSALLLAKHDPDLEQTVNEIARSIGPGTAPTEEADGLTFEEASAEFLSALDEMSVVPPEPATMAPVATMAPAAIIAPPAEPDPSLPQLERFLTAIHSYRQRRAV